MPRSRNHGKICLNRDAEGLSEGMKAFTVRGIVPDIGKIAERCLAILTRSVVWAGRRKNQGWAEMQSQE